MNKKIILLILVMVLLVSIVFSETENKDKIIASTANKRIKLGRLDPGKDIDKILELKSQIAKLKLGLVGGEVERIDAERKFGLIKAVEKGNREEAYKIIAALDEVMQDLSKENKQLDADIKKLQADLAKAKKEDQPAIQQQITQKEKEKQSKDKSIAEQKGLKAKAAQGAYPTGGDYPEERKQDHMKFGAELAGYASDLDEIEKIKKEDYEKLTNEEKAEFKKKYGIEEWDDVAGAKKDLQEKIDGMHKKIDDIEKTIDLGDPARQRQRKILESYGIRGGVYYSDSQIADTIKRESEEAGDDIFNQLEAEDYAGAAKNTRVNLQDYANAERKIDKELDKAKATYKKEMAKARKIKDKQLRKDSEKRIKDKYDKDKKKYKDMKKDIDSITSISILQDPDQLGNLGLYQIAGHQRRAEKYAEEHKGVDLGTAIEDAQDAKKYAFARDFSKRVNQYKRWGESYSAIATRLGARSHHHWRNTVDGWFQNFCGWDVIPGLGGKYELCLGGIEPTLTRICDIFPETAPSSMAIGPTGEIAVHIEGERIGPSLRECEEDKECGEGNDCRQSICTDAQGNILKDTYLYYVTLSVNPRHITIQDMETEFEIIVMEGNTPVPLDLNLSNDDIDNKIKLNYGEPPYVLGGNNTIVRVSRRVFDKVCIKFTNEKKIDAKVKAYLKDGMLCNLFSPSKPREEPVFKERPWFLGGAVEGKKPSEEEKPGESRPDVSNEPTAKARSCNPATELC